MPMNTEPSASSETTSQARPIHQEGRSAVDAFDPEELFYRRYSAVHVVSGQIMPQIIKFPKPSFTRSKFSRPEDVLHVDCCDGKQYVGWGVVEGKVSDLRVSAESGDKRKFVTSPRHVPEKTCYSHSELWCLCAPSLEDSKPSESAKEKIRILLSRALKVRIQATA